MGEWKGEMLFYFIFKKRKNKGRVTPFFATIDLEPIQQTRQWPKRRCSISPQMAHRLAPGRRHAELRHFFARAIGD